jgi:hypothetical protein
MPSVRKQLHMNESLNPQRKSFASVLERFSTPPKK